MLRGKCDRQHGAHRESCGLYADRSESATRVKGVVHWGLGLRQGEADRVTLPNCDGH